MTLEKEGEFEPIIDDPQTNILIVDPTKPPISTHNQLSP